MGDSVTPNEFRTAVAAAARNTAAAQAAIASQSTQIERLLSVVESITKSSTGAGTPFANFASSHAPNASPSAGTMSDGTPTELSHGSHSPARADTFDMLHREKNLLSNITGRRLEPFNQDVEDQVSHLLAKIITHDECEAVVEVLVVVDAAARRLRDRGFTCARVLASLSVPLRLRHTCRFSARCCSGLDQG